jgi:hypothetical protein
MPSDDDLDEMIEQKRAVSGQFLLDGAMIARMAGKRRRQAPVYLHSRYALTTSTGGNISASCRQLSPSSALP